MKNGKSGKIIVFFAASDDIDIIKTTTDLIKVLNGNGKVRGSIVMGKPGFTDQVLKGHNRYSYPEERDI